MYWKAEFRTEKVLNMCFGILLRWNPLIRRTFALIFLLLAKPNSTGNRGAKDFNSFEKLLSLNLKEIKIFWPKSLSISISESSTDFETVSENRFRSAIHNISKGFSTITHPRGALWEFPRFTVFRKLEVEFQKSENVAILVDS